MQSSSFLTYPLGKNIRVPTVSTKLNFMLILQFYAIVWDTIQTKQNGH